MKILLQPSAAFIFITLMFVGCGADNAQDASPEVKSSSEQSGRSTSESSQSTVSSQSSTNSIDDPTDTNISSRSNSSPISEHAPSIEAVYLENCESCHGVNGEGGAAPSLIDLPRLRIQSGMARMPVGRPLECGLIAANTCRNLLVEYVVGFSNTSGQASSAAPASADNSSRPAASHEQPLDSSMGYSSSAFSSEELMSSAPELIDNMAFFSPKPDIINECNEHTQRGFANRSMKKLDKLELLTALRAVIFAKHNYDDLKHVRQYRNLTSTSFDKRDPLQLAINEYPPDVTAKPGEVFNNTFSEEQINAWFKFVDLVAQRFSDQGWESSYVEEKCFNSPYITEQCWEEFITNFGKSVFRRPLTDEEVERFLGKTSPSSSKSNNVYSLVASFFLSPQFMYLVDYENSETDIDKDRVRLSQHEIANKVAFALTGQAPDSELLRAATENELTSISAVRQQASRIIRTEAAMVKFQHFFNDWLHLDQIPQPGKSWGNWAMIPDGVNLYNSNSLHHYMRSEVENYIRYLIWDQESNYQQLLTKPIAIVKEPRMQVVYQTPVYFVDGTPSETPNHPGIFTRAGLMAARGSAPIPIRRAMYIKSQALCQDIPSPDFSIISARLDGLETLDPLIVPNHEITSYLTASPICQACHQYINPVGFLFEAYNPIGQYTSVQNVVRSIHDPKQWPSTYPRPSLPYGVEYASIVQLPLPGPQSFFIEEGLPDNFATPHDLVNAIGTSKRGPACLSVRVFRHFHRRSETPSDACAIREGFNSMLEKPLLDAFVDLLVNEDIFWRKL